MDSVINKLRNTVSSVTSTVSQLSVVLPGNPVTREYEVNSLIASGGPGLTWKIYSGYKKSTKQEAAIFVFEKKQLASWSKRDREAMINTVKKGVNQLTRLRHPKFLTVQHPLEDSRETMAFATEPVFASLANILGQTGNVSESLRPELKSYSLHEVEIKYGLLQICDGLKFLQDDVKMIHGNLCPESIIINQQGAWKIFGLDFVVPITTEETKTEVRVTEYDHEMTYMAQQNLDYLAPEYTNTLTCCGASDVFSLGLLAYTAFSGGKPIVESCGSFSSHKRNLNTFKTSIPDIKLECIPQEMRHFEKRLLSFVPSSRPDFHEFIKFEFFHDESVKTLNYLDSLFQWSNLQKSKFYKGLSDILPKLPHRVRVHRIVPCLAQEFVNPSMVPFVLPNVLQIAEWSTNEEYTNHILPYLKDVMKLREPVQVLFIFMKYMELLLQKTPPEVTKSDVLPLLYGSLESDSVQVQESCLSIIPSFAALIDYPAMKNSLLPRVKRLCLTTQNLSVRVNSLVSLGKILDHLDKWLVMDFVLPFLMEIPSREPAVIMGIIGIYRLAVTHKKLGVSKEVIATKILPFVFPLSIENGLTSQQFSTIMNFIHEMIHMVETEHKAKLEEVGAIAKEQEQLKTELNNHSDFSGLHGVNSGNFMGGFNNAKSGISSTMSNNMSNIANSSYKNNNGVASKKMNNVDSTNMDNNISPFYQSSQGSSSNAISFESSPYGSESVSGAIKPGTQLSNNMPTPFTDNRPIHARDLTSTLIEANLRQMGVSSPLQPQPFPSSASMPAINTGSNLQQPASKIPGGFTNSPRFASMSPLNPLYSGNQAASDTGSFYTPPRWESPQVSALNHQIGTTGPGTSAPRHSTPIYNTSIPSASQPSLLPQQVKRLTQRDIDDFLQ